jgi:excisionase family DNA binding protein
MMAGANPAAVQRILRHSDPRITTEVYGHLAPGYLRSEIDRLSFGPPPPGTQPDPPPGAPAGSNVPPVCQDPLDALLGTTWPGEEPAGDGGLAMVGVAGFEPTTSCSQTAGSAVAGARSGSQGVGMIQERDRAGVQPSQALTANRRDFTSPVLPRQTGGRRLRSTDSGDELLTIKEIAAQLKISTATVYKLVDSGALRHSRILNAVRVSRRDLHEYVDLRRSG